MQYSALILPVLDLNRTSRFYKDVLGQNTVLVDESTVCLECGVQFKQSKILKQKSAVCLRFETEKLDTFAQINGKIIRNRSMEELQDTVILYDPDGYKILVCESLYSVACRQFLGGNSIKQTAVMLSCPIENVRVWYKRFWDEMRTEPSDAILYDTCIYSV